MKNKTTSIIYIALILWEVYAIIGISKNYFHYRLLDWVVVLSFMFLPCFLVYKIRNKQIETDEITSVPNQVSSETSQESIISNVQKDSTDYPQYIEADNTIFHVDNSPITDEEVPYLIQLGYEEVLRHEKESDNPKFHRTECEAELSFAFMMKYGKYLSIYIEQFESLYHAAYKTDDLSLKIELLKHSLLAFEKAKKFAYSEGKGGTIYFQDMYEHMHNSRNSCFSYADIIQQSLDSAIQERDVIIPGILQIVNDNDGILQKNIYDKLPSISKSDIQREIKELENKHMLTRTKKSNSYELHIIKQS